MTDHVVAAADEIGDGERIVVQVEGREVGIFNLEGEYLAYTNWCAHQGGPCCEGNLTGTWDASYDGESREVSLDWSHEGEILNCPWHGWEYDITTGECLSRGKVRLPSHDVRVEDDKIVLSM